MNEPADGDMLEALLRRLAREESPVPDAGFSAAVMARVRGRSSPVAPDQALAQLQRRRISARRDSRWSGYGIGLGLAAALGVQAASDGAPANLAQQGPVLTLALLISAAAIAWSLLNEPA